jgi:2-C-methyl-D-erythritol 4-phosphate cytidylyltransferase
VVQNDFLEETESLLRDLCRNESERFQYVSTESPPGAPSTPAHRGLLKNSTAKQSGAADCKTIALIAGGAERQDSVDNGLRELPSDCEWVLIHDGVRPFVSLELLENTWRTAQQTGAAIAALPATDTIKRVRKEVVMETLQRDEVWLAQTPQVFRRDIIVSAYREARKQNRVATDDAFLVECLGLSVSVVRGERSNIKITTPEDLSWGNRFLGVT